MRAFVEVDPVVGMKCLEAGLALKAEFQGRCYVQICVFAQDPIFSYADTGKEMQELLVQAVQKEGVEVIGSTPYVEKGGMSRQIKVSQSILSSLPIAPFYWLCKIAGSRCSRWPYSCSYTT